ncbi:MAG: hypothetical protein J7L82_06270, partial [Staphylothermus sp.]|nr:hypothetical protein [Staphylothermus sp.]
RGIKTNCSTTKTITTQIGDYMELKKLFFDKFVKDQRSITYLAKDEIALLTIMKTLSDNDEFFKDLFRDIIDNHIEFKKSLNGFGVSVIENILNPYKIYYPEKTESIINPEESKKKSFLSKFKF